MILRLYKSRNHGDDVAAAGLLRQLRHRDYPDLTSVRIEHVLRTEGITPHDLIKLQPLFANQVIERSGLDSVLQPDNGPIVEVSYQRALTDPELDSIRHAASSLNINTLSWGRLSTRYQFSGVDQTTADEIVSRYLLNRQVQTVVHDEWPTLVPQGAASGVETFDFSQMNLAELSALSDRRRLFLSDGQLLAIQTFCVILKRPIRDAELEMFAAAWSDHCSHTTWRAMGLLKHLQEATRKINHPLVVEAFIGNSGVMRFYDGWAINIKGETHISPTFAGSPYGGIMTKHGGVIRDIIFTGQGAYPIAGTTVMATCDPRIPWEQVPAGAFHPLIVLKESIRGTHDYTNPMGIPMAWSQYLIDPRNWKGFALGHSVGILPENRAKKGEPLPGDFVVLIGGPTGIDGIHGATVSSGSMTSETAVRDAAHVQIGMPIEERKFMEAVPILRDSNCIRTSTDCGAAGLSSAVGEMGSSCGVWVNLAWVYLKCAAMRLWEIWLSESQERGILAVPPNKLEHCQSILKSYGVPHSVIGVFTSSKRCQVVCDNTIPALQWQLNPSAEMSGTVAVDLPYSFLTAGCPLPKIVTRQPLTRPAAFEAPTPRNSIEWVELVQKVLGHYNICDQSAAAHQYDQTVQGTTVLTYVNGPGERMPDELFVKAPLFGRSYGVGIANSVNQFYGDIDPATFGRLMLASAATKLVAAGFAPSDINFCANVYSPPATQNPEAAWRLQQLVQYGYKPGSMEIGIPVTSGKDSSSGRFKNEDAPLTLDILAVGRMLNVRRLIRKPFVKPGDHIVLYTPGLIKMELGGSVLYNVFGQRGDCLPQLNLKRLRSGLEDYHEAGPFVASRSAIAEGGLMRRMFECCFGSNLGCDITVPSACYPLEFLFAELHGSILFTSASRAWEKFLEREELHYLGQVTSGPNITVKHQNFVLFTATVEELAARWSRTFSEVIA